jgi:pimeloyl-ACP methyl ester carboxylesterase
VEWRRILPWLTRHRRVFHFDMLSYGRSDKRNADVSRGVQNELFAALYEHWGLHKADIAALSASQSTPSATASMKV